MSLPLFSLACRAGKVASSWVVALLFFILLSRASSADANRKYLFDFRRINIYFLFCRTNSVRDLIFV
jgi:hypothetical protein